MKYVLITALLLLLAGCGSIQFTFPINEAYTFDMQRGADLIEPATTRQNTTLVTRGTVETIERIEAVVRSHSDAVTWLSHEGVRFGRYYVLPGDYVVAGQLLARMDVRHYETALYAAQTQLTRMERIFSYENRGNIINITHYRDTGQSASLAWAQLNANQSRERHEMDVAEIRRTITTLENNIANSGDFQGFQRIRASLLASTHSEAHAWAFRGTILSNSRGIQSAIPKHRA